MMSSKELPSLEPSCVTDAVSETYAAGANAVQPELCCPVDYNAQFLKVLPQEILDKDYGCGDPSKYVNEGETVLDLGSGGGKICYIASQVVGPEGRVIGVDMTPDMLDLAHKYQQEVGDKIGWHNVRFFQGQIENLKVDFEGKPMIEDESVDVVVSNCVLNLVAPSLKKQLFEEIFRVLKPSGRAVISDIVSNVDVPESMQKDSELWAGCISGAFQEQAFSKAFSDVGFGEIELLSRGEEPWKVVEGIEFRSVTLAAWKGATTDGLPKGNGSCCC
jgi:ubiquinone/menaquinone biosynthesis C-methylase UbiE